MNVVFLPFSDPTNPYQRKLAAALAPFGIEVRAPGRRPLQSLLTGAAHGKLDLVHLHWVSPYLLANGKGKSLLKSSLFLLACMALRAGGIKLVWSVHNRVGHECPYPELEIFARRVLWRLNQRIIVHCPEAISTLAHAYRLPLNQIHKAVVIPHGHFIDDYPNQISRREARRQLELDQNIPVWLYFGLIRPYKNVGGLIEVFHQMEGSQVLLLAGKPQDDSIREEINNLIEARTRIRARLEFIPPGQVQTYMNAADLVLLPFTRILTSSSVMLAASFAKAVVTPEAGCSPFILSHQKELLYDPTSPNDLYQALEASRDVDLSKIGRANLETAQSFPWSLSGSRTSELYRHGF